MNAHTIFRYCILAACALFWSCSTDTGPTQAGSETTNGIAVAVAATTIEGSTAPNATVFVYSADYAPDSITAYKDTIGVDQSGAFTVYSVPEGVYNIFAFADNRALGAAVQNVPVSPQGAFADTVPFDSLSAISGMVLLDSMPQISATVYVRGSPFETISDSAGAFELRDIPPGSFLVAARFRPRDIYTVYTDSTNIDTRNTKTAFVVLELDMQ
jgi:hypothetical protein